MKYVIPAVLALFLVTPAVAQERFFDLTGNVVWLDTSGAGTFQDLGDPTDIEFEGSMGYGLAANIFLGDRISTEFAVARVDSEATVGRRRVVGPFAAQVQMMPVTAVVQFHFAPRGVIDPYIGAGAAYMIFDDVDANGFEGIDRIDFDDDAGLAINAGIGIRLGNRFGLTLDGKYVPLESNGRATYVGGPEGTEFQVDVNPIILSAGLSLRF